MYRLRMVLQSDKYRWGRLVAVYLLLTALVWGVLFWRFPNNVVFANFYAEDGSVFLQNVLDKGWLGATATAFNGYAIVGLYLLCGLGWIINGVFLGGTLLTLPAAFAGAAMLFMAAVMALPYLLFARSFGRAKMLLAVAASALVPLPLSPHVVIGTIGNQKWIFLYLAFLLVLYRVLRHRQLGRTQLLAIDGALLVAAYTNSAVYLLMPAALVPYARDYWRHRDRGALQKILRRKGAISLLGLLVLLIPQIVYVLVNGIPKLPGYLDTPFRPERAIELFINRTYLFGVTHVVNGYMFDAAAVGLFVLLVGFGRRLLRGRERFAFFFGLYAAGVASVLFAVNRPGVTDHFHGYQASGSGPDQFFYAQTLTMYVPLVLVAYALAQWVGKKRFSAPLFGLAAAVFIVGGLASNALPGATWRNASVFENDAGIFTDRALEACQSDTDPVRVTVYPYKSGQFSVLVPRAQVCNNELARYQAAITDLALAPNNNDHLPLTKARAFTQTFVADSDGLNGIRLFISNFGKTYRNGTYRLRLLDQACQKTLRQSGLPEATTDSAVYNLRFEPIKASAGKTFCFTIEPPNNHFDPIAIQRSAPDLYPAGIYSENGQPKAVDAVFAPLYSKVR